jgi:hypothetical protein
LQPLIIVGNCEWIAIICVSEEFATYMQYTRQLEFSATPDYEYLRRLFANVMARNGWDFDWNFDWSSRMQVGIFCGFADGYVK